MHARLNAAVIGSAILIGLVILCRWLLVELINPGLVKLATFRPVASSIEKTEASSQLLATYALVMIWGTMLMVAVYGCIDGVIVYRTSRRRADDQEIEQAEWYLIACMLLVVFTVTAIIVELDGAARAS